MEDNLLYLDNYYYMYYNVYVSLKGVNFFYGVIIMIYIYVGLYIVFC